MSSGAWFPFYRRAPRGVENRRRCYTPRSPHPDRSGGRAMPPRRMTVLMPFHTPFYTPLSAGAALGHFADEGLDVPVTSAAAFRKSTVQALPATDPDLSPRAT